MHDRPRTRIPCKLSLSRAWPISRFACDPKHGSRGCDYPESPWRSGWMERTRARILLSQPTPAPKTALPRDNGSYSRDVEFEKTHARKDKLLLKYGIWKSFRSEAPLT